MYKRLIAFLNKGSLVFGKTDQQIKQLLRLLTKFQRLSMQMNTSLEFSLFFSKHLTLLTMTFLSVNCMFMEQEEMRYSHQ